MVHQHSALVPALTVAENLRFGDSAAGLWFHPRAERRAAEALSRRFELEVPVERRVEELSPGQRQRAEILRALGRGARLLILDEPTAVLTPNEATALFGAVRRLRDAGRAVIFISHKLAEVEAVADRVSILRRGRVVASVAARELDAHELGRLMLGRDLPPLARRTPAATRSANARARAARPLDRRARARRAGCAGSTSRSSGARSSASSASTATGSASSRRSWRACAGRAQASCSWPDAASPRTRARCGAPDSRTSRAIARARASCAA